MISVKVFTFNDLQENTYVLFDETKEGVIIDPGCYEKEEKQELSDFIEKNDIRPVRLLNTHCHVDHVLGNAYVSKKYHLTVETSKREEAQLRSVKVYAPMYGFHQYEETDKVICIEEGGKIVFGHSTLDILSVPGHSPGHLAFLCQEQNFCVAGDVLFYRSIGRADLPGGDYKQLEKSIKEKLYVLEENTVIYPGHGSKTVISEEKRYNPFVRV
jgi:glyoxylase-like metal-dependent hydrolase (beta-lactamase superfamily II)